MSMNIFYEDLELYMYDVVLLFRLGNFACWGQPSDELWKARRWNLGRQGLQATTS